MGDKVSPLMLATLREIAVELDQTGAYCVRANAATGRALHVRNLVDKILVKNSPWDHYRLTPDGKALLLRAGLAP